MTVRPRKFWASKEVLQDLYDQQQLTLKDIGLLFSVSTQTVLNRFRELGLTTRKKKNHRWRQRLSISHLGQTSPRKGIKLNDEYPPDKAKAIRSAIRARRSHQVFTEEANDKRRQATIRHWQNPECRQRQSTKMLELWRDRERAANMLGKIAARPNRLEASFLALAEQHNIPIRYTGNRSFWVGRCNPDFVVGSFREQRRVIETFGNYWHDPEDEAQRQAAYAKHNVRCLVIWENEMSNPTAVLNKTLQFLQ